MFDRVLNMPALRPATLLNRDSNTGVFLRDFKERHFFQNTSSGTPPTYIVINAKHSAGP